jgi:cardiolipin synthase
MTLIGLFSAARTEINIMVPYFLPPREMMVALQAAVLRGVRVRVILPERSNLRMVDWATRKMLWELLVWNVEIYYKPELFDHAKLILLDDQYAMGGSANLDARSLRLNFEVGVEMLGGAVNQTLRQHFEQVLSRCRRAGLEELDRRSHLQKARDAFFWLFSDYL